MERAAQVADPRATRRGNPATLPSRSLRLLRDNALGHRTCAAAISIRLRPARLAA